MNNIYLTMAELSEHIKYDAWTIRQCLKDSVLLEGKHYIRPFGGRKILYIWEITEEGMQGNAQSNLAIPMASGRVYYG
ncbi:MAG: hypothetical protein ACTHWH_08490 [Marinobacter sp.]